MNGGVHFVKWELRSVSEQSAKRSGRPVDTAKRNAMMRAAAKSFFNVGFAASSIEQIAADAGVSKVTVYNHFGDKSGIFTAAVEHECEKMRGYFSIDLPADGESENIRDRIMTIGFTMHAFLSRPEMIQFERRIAAETEHEPAIGLAFLNAGPRRIKAALATFLAHADATGELSVPDPTLAAEQFASMCKGFGDLERRFGAPDDVERDQQRIESAVDVFLKAYALAP